MRSSPVRSCNHGLHAQLVADNGVRGEEGAPPPLHLMLNNRMDRLTLQ